MNRKFIYLINPVSGTRGKILLAELIKKKTTEKNIPYEIFPTNAAGNYAQLKQKVTSEKVTDIIICGGDGTISQVANALQGMPVNIGIIPMGSGNGLALAAKIPRQISKALEIIFAGNANYIDSFYINNQFSCMLSGLGFDAQVAHDFARQKKRGFATYVKESTRGLFAAKPYPFELLIDDKPFITEAFFISIANSNQFGNNFTIAPQASLNDGLLDIVVVNKMSKLRMIWSILWQIRSGRAGRYDDRKGQRNDIHYFQTKKLTIKNPGLAPLHIDGDPATTNAVFEIEVIRNAFKLLAP